MVEDARLSLERCLLPPSISPDEIDTYLSLVPLLAFLCAGAMVSSMFAQVCRLRLHEHRHATLARSSRACRNILICLIISSLLHQTATAFSCRPFEIFNDLAFISMLTVQYGGFGCCLLFSYILGCQMTLLRCR